MQIAYGEQLDMQLYQHLPDFISDVQGSAYNTPQAKC